MLTVFTAIEHLNQADLELTDSQKCSTTAETQIKIEQDIESRMEKQVMPLLKVRVSIDGAEHMPLMEAVDCSKDANAELTDSEECSTTKEIMDTNTTIIEQETESSMEEQVMPLLNGRVNIDVAGRMPLLEAVDHLKDANVELTDNEECSTTTEIVDTNTDANATRTEQDVESNMMEATSKDLSISALGRGKRKSKYQDTSKKRTKRAIDKDIARNKWVAMDFSEETSKKQTKRAIDRDIARNNWVAIERGKKYPFEKRLVQLKAFKHVFGHCNVTNTLDHSLGEWSGKMRFYYKKIQKGMPVNQCLTQDRIKRLEEIGFQWIPKDLDEQFEQRCRDLEAFKSEFGHCDVPKAYYRSLGQWCIGYRTAYRRLKTNGEKPKQGCYISQDRIERLEKIGFQWEVIDFDKKFEERCCELEAFKSEFGHCNVPSFSEDSSLGRWCVLLRCAFRKFRQGKDPGRRITPARIKRLEEIEFMWEVPDPNKAFEQRCRDLEAFKSEFGHCNIPYIYSADPSLGKWCNAMRCVNNEMKKLGRRKNKFFHDRIECLEEIGFQWEVIDHDNALARRSLDLDAFKGELGKSISMMGI